jgi:hypothetical protein
MADRYSIKDVQLFDGDRIIPRTSILIENDVVASVGERTQPPAGSHSFT